MNLSLLDTDTLSEVLKQRNSRVVTKAVDYLAKHAEYAISAITRYELLRGLKDRGAVNQQTAFERFCQHSKIAPVNDAVLDRATDLWVLARRGGHPGRDADLIIAATALELGRALATGNTKHFSWIPGLLLEDWRQ